MLALIGELLPLAAAIAISPLPIIAAILMILSPRANVVGSAFLIGWIAGLVIATVVFAFLGTAASDSDPNASKPVTGTIMLVLGLALMWLGWRQWQARPKPGETAKRPGWMGTIDQMSFTSALGLGAFLSGLNLKNMMYEASAGALIGKADLALLETAVVLLVFVVFASLTVGGPIIAYSVAPERFAAPLESARVWLEQNNATIMTVVLTLVGLSVVGKGLGSF
ncbi:MAG: GAP family protein [Thermomicrobiales bacterium]|nr:GAP family protein [Thermomicrobiales bacterium]